MVDSRISTTLHRLSVCGTMMVLMSLIFAGTALAQTGAIQLKVLQVDSTAFPKVRLYVEAPDPSWADGSASIEFLEKAGPDILKALEKAEKANTAGTVTLPDKPVSLVTTTPKAFSKQKDPNQGMLVVFALDASGSMFPKHKDTAAKMVKAIIDFSLRDIDKMALVGYAADPKIFFAAKADKPNALIALKQLYAKKLPGSTKIYDSFSTIVDTQLSRPQLPSLPYRRVVVVLSDGEDKGSVLNAKDLATKFRSDVKNGVLITLGVGSTSPGARKKNYKDLKTLASLAGQGSNFSATGTHTEAKKTFDKATQRVQRQLLVEFEVPLYNWRKGRQQMVLTLTPKGKSGGGQNVTSDLDVSTLSPEQLKKGQDYRAALKALQTTAVSDKESKKVLIIVASAGGAFLLLVLFLIISAKKRRRREEMRQAGDIEARRVLEDKITAGEDKLIQEMEKNKAEGQEQVRKAAGEAAEAARTVLARFVCLDGPLKGSTYDIKDPMVLVGRDPEKCQLSFPSDQGNLSISRIHAQLAMETGGWQVTCMSDGGMYLNQTHLRNGDPAYPLHFGDKLKMGKSIFRFEQP